MNIQSNCLKFILSFSCLALCFLNVHAADTLAVSSPSGKISVKLWMDKQMTYCIYYDGKMIIEPSVIDLLLEKDQALSKNNAVKSSSVKAVKEQIISPVPEKRKIIPDVYNLLMVSFKKPYKIEFRVYNDGAAYRISTLFKDSVYVKNEVVSIAFPGQPSVYFPAVQKRDDADIFHTSFEELYPLRKMDSIMPGTIGYSPVLVVPEANPKIGITESDLEDYPGMFIGGTGSNELTGVFAPYPLEEKSTEGMYPQMYVTKRADYIAHTAGSRSFPWRVFLIAKEDKELPGNDIVYRLASPSKIGDASWVKPGNLTDEWIIDINLFNVPFRAGLNTASYKYYIDFAKHFGFDRIMMDAGWSDNTDLFKITSSIDMDTILAYAKEKEIKISMWTLAKTLNRQLDSALDRFNKWGVDFIMTDFIDRDDQETVSFYHRIAKACAQHKIMIMYHGAYPPKGFNRTYPNAVAREGVLGSEYNIWSNKVTPGHDLILPFTRMLAGSLDYEPGLLNNAIEKIPRPIAGTVTSPGTRCHQLAMFLVYDSPMQIFSGNPSEGMQEPEYMGLLGSLPTTWDETIITDAKVGGYIITARKKDNNWYIGGMCDWKERDLSIHFNFLDNASYKTTICKDGINADRYAADYIIEKNATVKKDDVVNIHLAPGGGFIIKLEGQ